MSAELEHNVLSWIAEELGDTAGSGSVPVKLLLVRMAIISRSDDETLTQSTVISLNSFDRANLFRMLMQLQRKHHLAFVDEVDAPLSEPQVQELYAKFLADEAFGQVILTDQGRLEVRRLSQLHQNSQPEGIPDLPETKPEEIIEN